MRWKFLINHKNMHWKNITNYFDFIQLCVSGVLSSQNPLQAQGIEWFSFKICLLGFSSQFLSCQSGRNRPFRLLRVYLCTLFSVQELCSMVPARGTIKHGQCIVMADQCGSTTMWLYYNTCYFAFFQLCVTSHRFVYCVIQC